MQISAKQRQRANNKTTYDVTWERDSRQAVLINYSTKHKVEICWAMNDAAKRDGVFLLKIGDKEAIISAEELRRFLRWV